MIESCNWQLLNEADYEDFTSLKRIMKMYRVLYLKTEKGDSVAASIWVDLRVAIYENPGITRKQLEVADLICGQAMPEEEVARCLELSPSSVRRRFNTSVKRVQKKLLKTARKRP